MGGGGDEKKKLISYRIREREINRERERRTIPGIYPRQVNKTLIQKSAPQPLSRKTPINNTRERERVSLSFVYIKIKCNIEFGCNVGKCL